MPIQAEKTNTLTNAKNKEPTENQKNTKYQYVS